MGTRLTSKWSNLAACLLFMASLAPAMADDPAPAPDASIKTLTEESTDAQRSVRAYLQLQEQLHSALLAIEQARQEADSAAKRNAETLTARLKLIEQSIAMQREREMESIQGLNRLVIIAVGVFAGIGLLGLFCTGWLQLRAMNRLAEVATAHPPSSLLGFPPTAGALLAGDPPAGARAPEPANTRLLSVIDRLDARIRELENAASLSAPGEARLQPGRSSKRDTAEARTPASNPAPPVVEPASKADPVPLLLGKGQALLHLGQVEKALACFDEVLALDPQHTEALLKKGSALERLEKLEEAIACYDRAIALNDSMTLAYLQKGGVFNRLERFDEALKCYEQALRTQEKS